MRPRTRRCLQGESYREENAVAQNEQNRRGRGGTLVQQPVTGSEGRDRRRQEQPVSWSEVEARARQALVGHKGRSLRGNCNAVKQLGHRRRATPTPRPAVPVASDRAAAAAAPATRARVRSEERRVGKECRSRWSP